MSKYHNARWVIAESDGARREREIAELDRQFEQPPVVPANRSLHRQLLAAGVDLDHHESDLYAMVTPESRRIVEESGHSSTMFTSEVDGKLWYDLPFAFEPFWRAKMADDSRHQPTTDVRHPMYEVGDKIGELRVAVVSDPTMKADQILGGLLQGLRQASDAVHKHLDANYRWD